MAALRRLMPNVDLATADIPVQDLMALEVTMPDFLDALHGVEPSALREVLTETPDVTWDEVGGLDEAKTRCAKRWSGLFAMRRRSLTSALAQRKASCSPGRPVAARRFSRRQSRMRAG